jgi:hypothetical protein
MPPGSMDPDARRGILYTVAVHRGIADASG